MVRSPIPPEISSGGVIAIGRRLNASSIVQVAEALVDGGVSAFEVTLNSADGVAAIRALAQRYSKGPLLVGAGTILDISAATTAVEAGARFLVSPHADMELISWAVDREVPIFPGAFSPTEILAAWRAGASAVKLFPASVAGPAFVREMRGPLPEIPLIPTGGVTVENAPGFIAAGAVALGVGGWLTGGGSLEVIRQRSADLVRAVRSARS